MHANMTHLATNGLAKTKTIACVIAVFLFGLIFAHSPLRAQQAANSPSAKLIIKETPLGTADADKLKDSLVISKNQRHVVWVEKKDGKFTAVRDGIPQKAYDGYDVDRDMGFAFPPAFSDDGLHLAYSAQAGKQWTMVLDGQEGPFFDDISPSVVFSPDGA